MENSTAEYPERAALMKRESNDAELVAICEAHQKFETACKGLESGAIESVNRAREIGILLQAKSGHQQVGFEFWEKYCEGNLPFDFERAKHFTAIARRMERPAVTLGEAVQFMQPVFVAGGILELPERSEPQSRSTVNILERFFLEMTLMRAPFKKIIQNQPMEEWDAEALDKFVSETEWVADERSRAERYRKAK